MEFFIINQMIATLNHLAAQPGVDATYHAVIVECIVTLKKLQAHHW